MTPPAGWPAAPAASTVKPGAVVPLATGTLLASASAELERQILAVVPPGKNGAAMTIVDESGVRLGIAATYKGVVTVGFEVEQVGWKKMAPKASLKVKAVF